MAVSVETRLATQETTLLALQGVVSYVFSELAKADPKLAVAIKAGFDNATLSSEVLAMKEGQSQAGDWMCCASSRSSGLASQR